MAVVLAVALTAMVTANDRAPTARPAATEIELFAGIERGDLEVKLIPQSDKEANLLIKNKTKQPVSVRLPQAFAGVPVLAQLDGGFGGGGRQRNNDNDNNQNQALGGGLGGGGLGGGGLGGGAFNVAPEKVGKLKAACVCLEHGKENPNPRVPYELRPIEKYTKDAKVHEVLKLLGDGKVNQRIAQAAAWHFANRLSWEQLANKKIDRLGRPDEPYFSPAELQSAMQLAAVATKAAEKNKPAEATGSPDSLSRR